MALLRRSARLPGRPVRQELKPRPQTLGYFPGGLWMKGGDTQNHLGPGVGTAWPLGVPGTTGSPAFLLGRIPPFLITLTWWSLGATERRAQTLGSAVPPLADPHRQRRGPAQGRRPCLSGPAGPSSSLRGQEETGLDRRVRPTKVKAANLGGMGGHSPGERLPPAVAQDGEGCPAFRRWQESRGKGASMAQLHLCKHATAWSGQSRSCWRPADRLLSGSRALAACAPG